MILRAALGKPLVGYLYTLLGEWPQGVSMIPALQPVTVLSPMLPEKNVCPNLALSVSA